MRNWLLTAALVLSAAPVQAQTAPTPNDYSDEKNWLCRPGRQDACAVDLAATVVAADGTTTAEPWTPEPNAPIDCFYVYPTISTDQSPNSDMNPDPAELNVIRQQFARFGSVCKLYAPIYRQITLAGLRSMLNGPAIEGALSKGLGYDDVRDAWNTYLKRDNRGRGVVLVGHSQGAMVLTALIHNEIEGKPIQSQLVSALLLGTTVLVPRGRDVGGSFSDVPLCRVESQVGCVITYASFRSTVPPAANSLFGRGGDNMTGACTNPAALEGGSGSLHAYLSATGRTITGTSAPKEWATGKTIETPWVSVPGLLSARCTNNDYASYLEVTVNGNPDDPRIDNITGDLGTSPQIQGMWGLHLIDVNLGVGNLLDVVSQQSRAYTSRNRR